MPGSYGNYAYVALFLVAGMAFVLGVTTFAKFLGPSRPGPTKNLPYECGEVPATTEAWVRYNVRYYLFAMVFVLFDVEAAFLIPWAVVYKTLVDTPMFLVAVVDMLIFLGILITALLYAWRKGALKWV